jgi:cytochrome b
MLAQRFLGASMSRAVLAWDGPTRLFKWALVLLIFDAWLSNKFGGGTPNWHRFNGYGVLVLVVFRVLWGFFGGSTARFTHFVRGPGAFFAYLGGLLKGARQNYLGHNPVGGAMVLALLATAFAIGALGLFSADEDRLIISGPLAKTVADATVDWAAKWHHKIFDLLMVLAALHVAANIFYQFVKKQPLITGMATGYKPAEPYLDEPEAQPGGWGVAIACFLAAAALVFGVIFALGGRPF